MAYMRNCITCRDLCVHFLTLHLLRCRGAAVVLLKNISLKHKIANLKQNIVHLETQIEPIVM